MDEVKEEQIDLRDYLRVILKRRWTVITVFAVILITVAIHAFTATPIYEATTRLIIDKENPNVVSIQEVMAIDASGTDYYQTQYKILESRSLARDVIKRLNLQESEEFLSKPKDDIVSNLKRSVLETITNLQEAAVALFKTENKTSSESSEASDASEEKRPDTSLVSAFISKVNVSPIRNSRLVDVSFQAKDPVMAAKIVNTLSRSYIEQNLETKLKAVQDAVKWLHNRIEDERKKVEKADLVFLRYKEAHNIVTDFSEGTETVKAQKLANLEAQVVEAESKRVEAETHYKQTVALESSPDMMGAIPEVLSNELIRRIKEIEVELYKRMSELSKKYGQNHPQMMALESEMITIQNRKKQEIDKVITSLRNRYQVALARENSLKDAFVKQKKDSLELNKIGIEYSVLRREAESAKQMYELLIKRFKEASVTEDMRTGNIRIVDEAEVPKFSIKPRKGLNILLAIIVGLVTGVGLAFFFEYLDNTIKMPEDVKQYLKIPYLGPVPVIAEERAGNPLSTIIPELITFHSPKSTASEAYRGIRTSILFSSADSEPQVILVSSAGPKEGKTISTVNLAITMAQSGSKVLIMDCDLRRPRMHKLFDLPREKGITNLLVGNMEIRDAIITTQVSNLDIIPSGPIPPNPSEILGSSRMTKLLEALKRNYSRILIDSPPITAVTDAVILAKAVDGVVLVVRTNDTPREIIMNGINQLQGVGAHLLGAILNGVDMGRDSYYYYQYYYYYYGEDGEKKKKSRRQKRSKSRYSYT